MPTTGIDTGASADDRLSLLASIIGRIPSSITCSTLKMYKITSLR